jgi:hypothetical protein
MGDTDKKMDISADGLTKLLAKSLENFQEERDLALERYRRQDDMITTAEDFVLQGKNAVDYLKTAADRSNAIFGLAKLMKEIVYKDDSKSDQQGGGGGMNDDLKKEILKTIKENE